MSKDIDRKALEPYHLAILPEAIRGAERELAEQAKGHAYCRPLWVGEIEALYLSRQAHVAEVARLRAALGDVCSELERIIDSKTFGGGGPQSPERLALVAGVAALSAGKGDG